MRNAFRCSFTCGDDDDDDDDDDVDDDTYSNSQWVGAADDWSTGILRREPIRLDTARQLQTQLRIIRYPSRNSNNSLMRGHLPDCRGEIH